MADRDENEQAVRNLEKVAGRDLTSSLCAGLARIYGTRTPLPDGRDSRGGKKLVALAISVASGMPPFSANRDANAESLFH